MTPDAPSDPPAGPSGPPDLPGPPGPPGPPGLPPRSADDVYDLGSAAEADEIEKARAIEEVVNLAARKARNAARHSVGSRPPSPPTPPPRPSQRASSAPPAARRAWDAPTPEVTKDVATDEKDRVLRDVVAYATTMEWETAAAKPMQSYRLRPIVLVTTAMLSLLLGAYTFTARPQWVFGPDPARVPWQRREGHMQFAMYLTAQRLYAYGDSNAGVLPPSLTPVGENWPGLRYKALGGGTFELEAFEGSSRPLRFRSDGNLRMLRDAALPHLRAVTP